MITEEQKQKRKEYLKEYYKIPEVKKRIKEYHKKYTKKYYQDNKEIIKEREKEYNKNNKEKIKEKRKEYFKGYFQRPEVKVKKKEYFKGYFQRPEIKQRTKDNYKEYHKNNKDRNKKRIKEYRQTLKGKQSINNYQKQRKEIDLNYYLICKLRCQVKSALRRYSKTGKIMTSKKYGIDYKAIIEHFKPFPKDIRGYDIHHIKQLSKFNFINEDGTTNIEEVKKSFTPKNLILLTEEEHRKIPKECS